MSVKSTSTSYAISKAPGWHARAACDGTDVNVFFPPVYTDQHVARARQICNACPVRQQCLDEAIEIERDTVARREGVFGGMTPDERYEEWLRRTGAPRARARAVQYAA